VAWVAHNLAHSNHTQSAKCNDRCNKQGSISAEDFFPPRKRRVPYVGLNAKDNKVKIVSVVFEIIQRVFDVLRRKSAV
jgi:hypothetical protein